MSSIINKEWMNEDNFETDAYRDGVLEFLTFVHKNLNGDQHSCPCRRCRNGTGQIHVGDIFVDLMKYGMDKNYTVWRFHGETSVINEVHQPPQPVTSTGTTEHVDESDLPKLDDLVNDACEIFTRDPGPSTPNFDKGNEGNRTSTVPNDPQTCKGKKYERLHQLSREPLHPSTSASRHTTMYALVKLNDLKTQYNLSDGATGGILGLLNELLPEGNNLTTNYSEMKNTIKDFGMDYVNYGCLLTSKAMEPMLLMTKNLRVSTHAPSSATPSLSDLIPCEIHSYIGEVVGYGRKAQLSAVTSVHGHRLKPREVRVVLDNIKMPEFPVWGGQQGPCHTLADVGKGGFMYWHDDFLPPLDDTQEA